MGGNFDKIHVAINSSGAVLCVWQDPRNGAYNIYGQLFSPNGEPIGKNFKVGTTPASNNEYFPWIDSKDEKFLVIWRPGYGQWLEGDGSLLDTTFLFTWLYANQKMVLLPSGNFVVTWHDWDEGNDIFVQKFSSTGDSLTPRIKVNNDTTYYNQHYPDIAIDGEGNIYITWIDERTGYREIYAQVMDSSLNFIGTNIRVSDEGVQSDKYNPTVAVDYKGNFIVAWTDYRNGDSDIYAQRFDSTYSSIGSNFKVNDDNGQNYQYYQYSVSAAMDSSGKAVLVWRDMRNGNYDIYAQIFAPDGSPMGGNFRVDQDPEGVEQRDPTVALAPDGGFVVAWVDEREHFSLYKRSFDSSGSPIESEWKINDVTGVNNQDYPCVSMAPSGTTMVVWGDYRNPNYGVYYTIIDPQGYPTGNNTWLQTMYYYPFVTYSPKGNFIVTGMKDGKIFLEKFSLNGEPISSLIEVTDTGISNYRYKSSVGVDNNGNTVVVWEDTRNGDWDIYLQIIDSTGNKVGSNLRVNTDSGSWTQSRPSVAVSNSGRFLVVWENWDGDYDIYARIFRGPGNPIGEAFKVTDDSLGETSQVNPYAVALPNDRFLVVWSDYQVNQKIVGVVLDTLGNRMGPIFEISDDFGFDPSIAVDSTGRVVVTWATSNFSGDYNIYAQRLDQNMNRIGYNKRVNNSEEGENKLQYSPSVATNGSLIFFSWVDPKWQKGYDIAGKLVDWESFETKENYQPFSRTISLGNPSPNPFSDNLKIVFGVSKTSTVSLKIYNGAGRLVRILYQGQRKPGLYRIIWDGLDRYGRPVSEGVYFINIKTQRTNGTKKVLRILKR